MHYKKRQKTKYLGHWDLDGKEHTVKITKIHQEDVTIEGGVKPNQTILTFENRKKTMILNSSNADTIASIHGPEDDDWIGKEITLFPGINPRGSYKGLSLLVKPPEKPVYITGFNKKKA